MRAQVELGLLRTRTWLVSQRFASTQPPLWTIPSMWLCEVLIDMLSIPEMIATSQVYERLFDDLESLAKQAGVLGAYRSAMRPRLDLIRWVARRRNRKAMRHG
jgi:hypothetical protein